MYLIDRNNNRIDKIKTCNFSDLGFREREHLQEWLENQPEALGEELLIIQKEFADFDDTRERLDLLALDKQGDLVIIENKLDDSGRDATWQALKYASYCSSLSKRQIKDIFQSYLNINGNEGNSEEIITEFLETEDFDELMLNENQRIVLVAGGFRKEVTSTVMYLLTKYNLQIQCFKAIPYKFGEQILVDFQQIIPVPEAREFTIRMAEKSRQDLSTQGENVERIRILREFWRYHLEKFNSRSSLFSKISPSRGSWISAGSGFGMLEFEFSVGKNYARSSLSIKKPNAEENKLIFDKLTEHQDAIETITGKMEWQRMDDKKSCRIKQEISNVNIYNREDWSRMSEFLTKSMLKLESAFREPLQRISREIN